MARGNGPRVRTYAGAGKYYCGSEPPREKNIGKVHKQEKRGGARLPTELPENGKDGRVGDTQPSQQRRRPDRRSSCHQSRQWSARVARMRWGMVRRLKSVIRQLHAD